jgi:hypothetical protein
MLHVTTLNKPVANMQHQPVATFFAHAASPNHAYRVSAGILHDMLAFTAPRHVPLLGAASWRSLVFVYDWDTAVLADNVTVFASSTVSLCTDLWPCALQLMGEANNPGVVVLYGEAQLECLSSVGCSGISLHSVAFTCSSNVKSAFKIQGSNLTMSKVSFAGCRSKTDGGVVQAYDLAKVVIEACNFTDVHSGGFGGAVALHGSSLSVSGSRWHNCSSSGGGGAVWASVFQDCYGSNRNNKTYLRLSSSSFILCSTGGTIPCCVEFCL